MRRTTLLGLGVVLAALAAGSILLLSGSGSAPPGGAALQAIPKVATPARLSVLTDRRAELVDAGARVRLRAPRDTPLRLELFLAGGPRGAAAVPLASQRLEARGRRDVVRLVPTDLGDAAARSCLPLELVAVARRTAVGGERPRASRAEIRSRPVVARRRLDPPGPACRGQGSDLPAAGASYEPAASPPVDPEQQTQLEFGQRSHWLQPWKGYLDTPPAARLREAPGINFNVSPEEAEATARLLALSGFRRARVEIPWGKMDYHHPDRLADEASVRRVLVALRRARLRPLILLNANHGGPAPALRFEARIAEAAPEGSRSIRLDPPTARAVVPGKTGIDAVTPGTTRAPDILVTSVDPAGVARLARPLPRALEPGGHPATTLRYGPFGPPELGDGSPNPAFEETIRGWLTYVRGVTRLVGAIFPHGGYDVEVWNELSFGSDFLSTGNYFDPPPAGRGDVKGELLARTVDWLRDARNRVGPIRIGNGFASQTPFAAPSTSPPGLTALDKHPYPPRRSFPADAVFNGVEPLDATGRVDGRESAPDRIEDGFIPRYDAFFPEYFLTAIQTEHLVRDVSPIPTDVYDTEHGRSATGPDGRTLDVWVTEIGMDPGGGDPARPGALPGAAGPGLTDDEVRHLQAKAALRTLVSFVNKGVSAVDLFAAGPASGEQFALVAPEFLAAAARSRRGLVSSERGGEVMDAVRRLEAVLTPIGAPRPRRPLVLEEVADLTGRAQFRGDGTPEHPSLYDRDVVGFFPFQLDETRWAVPVYVMTRNLTTPYASTGDSRYDLPEEPYRLTVAGVDARRARVSLYDPLTGRLAPARATATEGGRLEIELLLTDSPRILVLGDQGAG